MLPQQSEDIQNINRISVPYPGITHFYRGSQELAKELIDPIQVMSF